MAKKTASPPVGEERGEGGDAGERRVLERLRELLETQRDRFREYLTLLETQRDLLESAWTATSGARLEAQVNREDRLVGEILSIQKAIEPLEALYPAAFPPREGAAEIPALKTALEELRTRASTLLAHNRSALAREMEAVKDRLKTLERNPLLKSRSVYAATPSPTVIDIEG